MKIISAALLLLTGQLHAYFFMPPSQKPFIILIEAQGNPNTPGRTIDDSFESEITLNAAHLLKNALEQWHQPIRIIVQRSDGLSSATMTNKLNANLYLAIGACKGMNTGIYLFQFTYHDQFLLKDGLSFIPYDQLYLINQAKTTTALTLMSNFLKQRNLLQGSYAFPYRPLIGIKAPALGIELSLKNKSDWSECITAVAHSLASVIKES